MELTYQEVQEVMAGWSIRYREAGYTPDQLEFLTDDYLEDLADEQVTSNQFQEAVKLVRKRCRFFPKVADILEAREKVCRNPSRYTNNLQIADTSSEHDLTPEEIDKNLERLKILGQVVTGEITPEEGEQMQEELNQKNTFSGRLRVVGE